MCLARKEFSEILGREKRQGDVQLSTGTSLSLSGIFIFTIYVYFSCNSSSEVQRPVNLYIGKSVTWESAFAISW